MKKSLWNFYGPLFLLTVFAFASCEKSKNDNLLKGKAEFSLSIPEAASKSLSDSTEGIVSYHIMVSVTDQSGNAVVVDSLIPVYAFGTGFTSENIELGAGEYKLTKFLVLNPSGAVILAAPLEGSPLAYLVNDPLPVSFSIFPGQVTRISPEVLVVEGHTPADFGYAAFGMEIIKPLDFWTICVLDPGNPLIMAPIQITTARVTVISQDGWRYTFGLEAAPNHLVIRGGSATYTFILEKEGYFPQKLQFSAAELMAATKENPLILRITWDMKYNVIFIQPGPLTGKDAMISNLEPDKNFGDYKYFEATFLTEPVLTVMRSNRSLISFNLDTVPKSAVIQKVILTLSYDLPIPFDTSYIFMNTGPAWIGGVLQQVVEPWDEHKVTWNTEPKTIETNQVYISPFIKNANFISVDVTRLFVPSATTDNAVYPNYGMLFRLWPDDRFPGFRFASGDYPVPEMRPKLAVYYTMQ